MRLLINFSFRLTACGNSNMWFWRMCHHQGWIRYPSEISINRKGPLGRSGMWNTWSWEDQKSIKERLGIIFQNSILEHVDWVEWVWLVAFVRIYMSFTRWHPTVQESDRGSALRLCLWNIPLIFGCVIIARSRSVDWVANGFLAWLRKPKWGSRERSSLYMRRSSGISNPGSPKVNSSVSFDISVIRVSHACLTTWRWSVNPRMRIGSWAVDGIVHGNILFCRVDGSKEAFEVV